MQQELGQGLLFGEAYGRVTVAVEGVPPGLRAVTIPVRRDGQEHLPRNRRGRLRVHEVDLVPTAPVPLFDPPAGMTDADLLWVLGAHRREWPSIVRRFGPTATQITADLARCGAVVPRHEVDELLSLGAPLRWRLSQSWSQQALERSAELRGDREPQRARAILLALMEPVDQLAGERELLARVAPEAGLVVPNASRTGTRAWSVYDAAVRTAATWWGLRTQGETEISLKQLAATALNDSKGWTTQQQAAFANLIGTEFEDAVREEDTDLRVKGPLSWRIGDVAADARIAQPWVGVPSQGLRLVGEAVCDARGVLVIENSDTFGQVCRRLPELTSRWLCVWGSGYARDQLVALLDWLAPRPIAAWCDLDADGIAIVDNLARRLGTPVHAVAMDAAHWHQGPYRKRDTPEKDKARDRKLAAELAERVAPDLRDLALAISHSGESREQETMYTDALPQLPALLEPLLHEATTGARVSL
ncbi:Wadjet anti-phage system protein JetD domain-containing protein [Kitasatospora purpeofusca]|uniref:Wadjet anti-phage system protein JetD domain-containing protein n=1 Tax=Kitasatospora purpeofusca TaxID=67352 RepID=UPI0030F11C0D